MSDIQRPAWDDYLMAIAFVVAMRSPDPSTKHGSVICDKNHRIIGVGYNGFPRGCNDAVLPLTRPAKYPLITHSEINSIINANLPEDPSTCTLYVTGHPCIECFKLIVQTGIRRIVYGPIQSACVGEDYIQQIKTIAQHTKTVLEPYNGPALDLLGSTIDCVRAKLKT